MPKLMTISDRIQAQIECAGCGRGIRVSGDTFAGIDAKLDDNGYGRDEAGNRKCKECVKGNTAGEEDGRVDADFADDDEVVDAEL